MNNPLDARLLIFALELLLKSSVILLAAFGMARLLRRASAQSHQLIWKATISSLLLLPLLCVILPTWKLPVQVEAAPVIAPPMESVVPLSTPKTTAPAPVIAEMPAPEIAPPPAYSENVLPPAMPDVPKPAYPIVLSIYLCGFGLVLLRSFVAFIRLHFLAQRAVVCTELHILNSAQEAARKLRLTRPVAMLIASPDSRERVPMTWGFWRPCLLLPCDAQKWEESRLSAVLLHEYAHIARADWLMQQIAALTCALYWFHPLVWKAAHALKLESERACDECVIAAGISSTDYAAILLETARAYKQRGFSPEGAISMAKPAHLTVRIQSILDSRNSRRTPSRLLIFCCSVLSLAGILALAALRPADASEPPESAPVVAMLEAEAPPSADPTEAKPLKRPSDAYRKQIDPRVAVLMKQVEAKAKSIRSLTADVEIAKNQNGEASLRGTVRLMKPNLYRMQFQGFSHLRMSLSPKRFAPSESDLDSGQLPFPLSNFIAPCVDY